MATRSMPFWPRPATTSGSSWPGSGLCALCSGPLSGSSDTAAAPLPHQLKRLNSLFHRRPAQEGDVVVVARLDRLARSTRDLLEIAEILKEGGTGLRSLGEPWADTTSPAGKMVLTVFAGMAEFERALIHQRTSSARVAARMRGVRFGRPPKLTPEQIALGRRLVDEGTSVRDVARVILKCHPATLYRELGRPSEHPGERSGRRVSATPRLAPRADTLLQVGHDAVRDPGIGVRAVPARRAGRAWLVVGLLGHVQFPSFLAGSGRGPDPCPSARPGEPGEGCGRGRPGCEQAGRSATCAAERPCRPVGRVRWGDGAAPPRRPAMRGCWPEAAVCCE